MKSDGKQEKVMHYYLVCLDIELDMNFKHYVKVEL